MKQTLGRQVVSTLPVKHILLLQHLQEPPSPVSTARPMWLTSGRISHEAVYAGRRRPAGAGPRAGAGLRAGAGPCTLVVRDHGIYQRRSRRIG